MTPPPGYREQDACANCKHCVDSFSKSAWCVVEKHDKPKSVELHAICPAHERRERGA